LVFALSALKQPAWLACLIQGFDKPAFIVIAFQATDTARPSDFHQMGQSVFFCRELAGQRIEIHGLPRNCRIHCRPISELGCVMAQEFALRLCGLAAISGCLQSLA
jgi:hypothetical protein